MFLDRLISDTSAPLLEKMLQFTSERQKLIAQNMANIDTPGYVQQDLDEAKFQSLLRDRVESQRSRPGQPADFGDISSELTNPTAGILFHDGNNRSIEQLSAEGAKNEAIHNTVVELLRKQYQQLAMALSEKVS